MTLEELQQRAAHLFAAHPDAWRSFVLATCAGNRRLLETCASPELLAEYDRVLLAATESRTSDTTELERLRPLRDDYGALIGESANRIAVDMVVELLVTRAHDTSHLPRDWQAQHERDVDPLRPRPVGRFRRHRSRVAASPTGRSRWSRLAQSRVRRGCMAEAGTTRRATCAAHRAAGVGLLARPRTRRRLRTVLAASTHRARPTATRSLPMAPTDPRDGASALRALEDRARRLADHLRRDLRTVEHTFGAAEFEHLKHSWQTHPKRTARDLMTAALFVYSVSGVPTEELLAETAIKLGRTRELRNALTTVDPNVPYVAWWAEFHDPSMVRSWLERMHARLE